MIYLKIYIVFAVWVSTCYVYLYSKHFTPEIVKNATWLQKVKVYGTLYITILVIAPYGLYEMVKTKNNGGFKK